ncbi:sulfatase [Lunatibacter salilacus]|uniref:sulfatase n=1 Tax=Lunatibacter salilacus TaxID=2483804 RepID=UPI00131B8C47|nr:sulfatase [Lunatibacter salilacus]
MKSYNTGFFIVFLLISKLLSCEAKSKPNIILINVDDLGWRDLGFMGSNYYETPNLDKLAGEGIVFYHAYAAAANCAPSRACMMSGMNTPKHGVYTVDDSERGNAKTRKIIPTPNRDFLPDSIYTLAMMLKDNGYKNGTFGKWHINKDPLQHGFHVNVGGSYHGNPGRKGYFSPYKIDFIENGPDGEYLTDRLTTEAIKFVEENKGNPFFLYLPFYSVHTPIMGKKELVEKFENKPGSGGQDRADYAAMVASVDENIGKLLGVLDELNLTENTFLIFTSDNGGIRDISYQTPLRAGKGSYYEGGIRVPLIVRWPGNIPAGSKSDFPVTQMDFYPTIRSIVGGEQRPEDVMDGWDISPLFRQEAMDERPLFWHFPIYLQAYNPKEDDGKDPLFRTRPGSVVRKGKWKLHHYFEDGDYELYDLEEDPGEIDNLAESQLEIRDRMIGMLNNWREGVNAPVPSQRNPLYDKEFEINLINESLNE